VQVHHDQGVGAAILAGESPANRGAVQRPPNAAPSASSSDRPPLHRCERISPVKNRMLEIGTSGTVRGEDGNILTYSAWGKPARTDVRPDWCVQQEVDLPGKSQPPRSLDSRVEKDENPEAYRQGLPWGDYELPGRNDSERKCGLERRRSEGRACFRRAKAARGAEI
jgi:hypothetical protein